MKNDFIYNEMVTAGADGVDFMPLCFDDTLPCPVTHSYTRTQWESQACCPKSSRRYWQIDKDDIKRYCDERNPIQKK